MELNESISAAISSCPVFSIDTSRLPAPTARAAHQAFHGHSELSGHEQPDPHRHEEDHQCDQYENGKVSRLNGVLKWVCVAVVIDHARDLAHLVHQAYGNVGAHRDHAHRA